MIQGDGGWNHLRVRPLGRRRCVWECSQFKPGLARRPVQVVAGINGDTPRRQGADGDVATPRLTVRPRPGFDLHHGRRPPALVPGTEYPFSNDPAPVVMMSQRLGLERRPGTGLSPVDFRHGRRPDRSPHRVQPRRRLTLLPGDVLRPEPHGSEDGTRGRKNCPSVDGIRRGDGKADASKIIAFPHQLRPRDLPRFTPDPHGAARSTRM